MASRNYLKNGGKFVLAAVIVIIITYQFLKYLHINLDDKYILYKYAQNLANGHGLCFNIGQRVEGFTSLSFVLLMAIVIKAGNLLDQSDTTLAMISASARLISLFFSFATFYYLCRFLKNYFRFSNISTGIALMLLALRSDFIFSSVNGMETGMFIFLFTAFTVHMLLFDRDGLKKDLYLFLFFGMFASLTRADGFYYIGIMLFTRVVLDYLVFRSASGYGKRKMCSSAGMFILAIVPGFVFRLWYFGDIFPNTYYVKMNPLFERIVYFHCNNPRLIAGWERFSIVFASYMVPCLAFVFVVVVCHCVALFFFLRVGAGGRLAGNKYVVFYNDSLTRFLSDPHNLYALLFFSISSTFFVMYTMYAGGDWMPGFRVIMHYFPLPFVVLISLTLEFSVKLAKNIRQDPLVAYSVLFAVIFFSLRNAAAIDAQLMHYTQYVGKISGYVNMPENHVFYSLCKHKSLENIFLIYDSFTKKLKSEMKKGDCIAIYEIGCISFRLGTDYHVVDLSSLNDRFLSHTRNDEGYYSTSEAYILDVTNEVRGEKDRYILSYNPLYVIFDTYMFFRGGVPEHIFGNRYQMVDDFPGNETGFFTVYERIK